MNDDDPNRPPEPSVFDRLSERAKGGSGFVHATPDEARQTLALQTFKVMGGMAGRFTEVLPGVPVIVQEPSIFLALAVQTVNAQGEETPPYQYTISIMVPADQAAELGHRLTLMSGGISEQLRFRAERGEFQAINVDGRTGYLDMEANDDAE